MDASEDRSQTEAWGLVLLLLTALALRLVVVFLQPAELTQDRDAYLGIATNLAEGRGYSSPGSTQPTAYRPPVYTCLLALGLIVLPATIVVGAINLIAGLLTVWLTERMGQSLNLGPYRFLAAGLVAVDPILLRYTNQPMTESVCTFFAALWLWSLLTLPTTTIEKSYWRRLSIGLAFGLLVLCRPTFWPIIVLWGPSVWMAGRQIFSQRDRHAWTRSVMSMICCPIGALIVVGPWLIRNWLVLGVPILTTTHGGYTLFLSNNPVFYREVVHQPWGTVWQNQSLTNWQTDIELQSQLELGNHASEVTRDRWYGLQARQSIAADPRSFAAATLHRVRSFWNTVPQGDAAEQVTGGLISAVGWYYTVILSLGVVGMVLVARRKRVRAWLPLYAFIATVQLAHLFYWTNTRMRAPLTPAISLFAAAVFATRRQQEFDSQQA